MISSKIRAPRSMSTWPLSADRRIGYRDAWRMRVLMNKGQRAVARRDRARQCEAVGLGRSPDACSNHDAALCALRRGIDDGRVEMHVIAGSAARCRRTARKRLQERALHDVADDATAIRLSAERDVLGDERGPAIASTQVAPDAPRPKTRGQSPPCRKTSRNREPAMRVAGC
jgi:hypothetical protein